MWGVIKNALPAYQYYFAGLVIMIHVIINNNLRAY